MPPNPKKARPSLNLDQFFQPASGGDDLDFLLGAPEETAQRAQSRGLPLRDLPVQVIAPDAEQVRRLPPPPALLQLEAAGDKAAISLLASLRELGESMRAHSQLQPAIVYPDTDPRDSAITHRLLHGQRRWTAAVIADLPTLWVVEVERPSEVSRLLRQVEENERRAGLVDMERAWALISLRDALRRETGQDIAWSMVEAQLQISEGRRHDILRLLRFSSEAQEIILRYGWAEWTLRPLHQAISAGTLDADTVADMLRVLADQPEVTAPTVAALIATYLHDQGARDAAPPEDSSLGGAPSGKRESSSEDADPVSHRLIRMRQHIERMQSQVARGHDADRRAAWRAEVARLQSSLAALLSTLENDR
ncbi:MAG: ParB N-terminal domain-containing protein [Oscillochloris sp.]|nr:ParB N-terminal domain-containing protein [Oscillochloris sp.]